MEKKRIGIFGATGSIGTQTLEIIEQFPDRFSVEILTARSNAVLLIEQAKKFLPQYVVIEDKSKASVLENALKDKPIKVLVGAEALCEVAVLEDMDLMLSAIVGFAGLQPTLAALQKGKNIALANKETLVVAGALIMQVAKEYGASVLPVDSEHSAIFQCLQGESEDTIEKIILTASGGPFLDKKRTFLEKVTKKQALKHPNWEMGAKITIDSATLMNKGLEMIEAKWLFDLVPEQIDVLVHPQSVIHSMIQFTDGSIKAQLGLPDMRLPIQYALTYPERIRNNFERLDFSAYPKLSFDAPDKKTFRNLALSISALEEGGNMPCVLNAANEEVVHAFLEDKIGFFEMTEIIEKTMEQVPFTKEAALDVYIESDKEARAYANELIEKYKA